jgi:PIN domain nuclease of toxin-antitoxin system
VIRFLLDTHLLIWALGQSDRLPVAMRDAIEATENTVLFSPISIWEIAIKLRLGRADFDVQPEAVAEAALAAGFTELRLGWQAAAIVAGLAMRHRDPFDQVLIAQASAESVLLFTADRKLAAYGALVRVV